MGCPICEHEKRFEIEQAILHISQTCTIESIADVYDVSVQAIKEHAILHNTVGDICGFDSDGEVSSLAKQVKQKEAAMVAEVMSEYLVTLKNVGRRINRFAFSEVDDVRFEKLLNKPIVDLYLGLGSEIRQTAKTLADINQILNGPQDNGSAGLVALSWAIKESANKSSD